MPTNTKVLCVIKGCSSNGFSRNDSLLRHLRKCHKMTKDHPLYPSNTKSFCMVEDFLNIVIEVTETDSDDKDNTDMEKDKEVTETDSDDKDNTEMVKDKEVTEIDSDDKDNTEMVKVKEVTETKSDDKDNTDIAKDKKVFKLSIVSVQVIKNCYSNFFIFPNISIASVHVI